MSVCMNQCERVYGDNHRCPSSDASCVWHWGEDLARRYHDRAEYAKATSMVCEPCGKLLEKNGYRIDFAAGEP